MADVFLIPLLVLVLLSVIGACYWLAMRTRTALPILGQFGGPGYGALGYPNQFGAVGREVEFTPSSPDSDWPLFESGTPVKGFLTSREPGPFGKWCYTMEYVTGGATLSLSEVLDNAESAPGRSGLVLTSAETDSVNPDPIGQALFEGLPFAVIAYAGVLPWGPMPPLLGGDRDRHPRRLTGSLRGAQQVTV